MCQTPLNPAEEEALFYGIDLTLLHYKQSLSYEERVQEHQAALDLVEELRRAGDAYYHEKSE